MAPFAKWDFEVHYSSLLICLKFKVHMFLLLSEISIENIHCYAKKNLYAKPAKAALKVTVD